MRCPFRVKAFDKPDTCSPDCAWRVRVTDEHGRITDAETCAITVMAMGAHYVDAVPINYEGKVDG